MQMMPLIKGTAAGAAAGTVCYILSRSPRYRRSALKRSLAGTVRSVRNVLDALSEMI